MKQYFTKKNIIIAIVIVILIVGGVFGYKKIQEIITYNKAKSELKDVLSKNLENWDLYQISSDPQDKQFGNEESCKEYVGDPGFLDYQKKVLDAPIYKLLLPNGISILYTENYEHWTNDQFLGLLPRDRKICSAGWPIPLYADKGKLVWGVNLSCGGSGGASCDNIDLVGNLIKDYFNHKVVE